MSEANSPLTFSSLAVQMTVKEDVHRDAECCNLQIQWMACVRCRPLASESPANVTATRRPVKTVRIHMLAMELCCSIVCVSPVPHICFMLLTTSHHLRSAGDCEAVGRVDHAGPGV